MLRLALAEWREWGGRSRDAWAAEAALETGPQSEPPAEPESDPANFPHILAYWQAVPDDHGAIPDNRRRYALALGGGGREAVALWAEPAWSAAFISWIFRTAGVDRPEFPPSATHAFYLDGLIAMARRWPDAAPFIPHGPADRAPAPGDLLCFDRSPAPLAHWTQRLAEAGRARPMHCDLVVATTPGVVEAVGGNVRDAVTLTRFPADATGFLLPPPQGRRPILIVMESRLGRLPPWGSAGVATR